MNVIQFGKLTLDQFMRRYWQRKPLLIRQAWPGFRSLLTPEELAGLACEPDVESRIVLEHGERPWELRHGPFDDSDFTTLPETHWTLLVQDAEKHRPRLNHVVDRFRFIPNWRIDDLMISYAAPGGSVGPHTDNYDVFLLQAHGHRHWHISTHPHQDDDLIPDIDLRVLSNFNAEQDWILEPGDMLYLPPRVAHHGVALDACMTYSIGFRAPSQTELASHFFDTLSQTPSVSNTWYTDAGLKPSTSPGCITSHELTQLRRQLRSAIQRDDAWLDTWLGCYLTQPKDNLLAKPRPRSTLAKFQEKLRLSQTLKRRPAALCSYIQSEHQNCLFVDGIAYPLHTACLHLAPLISEQTRYTFRELFPRGERAAIWETLFTLFQRGQLDTAKS